MLHIGQFNSNYISYLLETFSKESSKQILLSGDINYELLKCGSVVSLIYCLPIFITSDNFAHQNFFLIYSNRSHIL